LQLKCFFFVYVLQEEEKNLQENAIYYLTVLQVCDIIIADSKKIFAIARKMEVIEMPVIPNEPTKAEDVRGYKQIRTPDYAQLANLVNQAKGPDRVMSQFAEDTQIGASTLSRIVNLNIKKPLNIETIIAIFEARANKDDLYLLESLANANGFYSQEYANRIRDRHSISMRMHADINRERMMKNALIAGVVAAGLTVTEVADRPREYRGEKTSLMPMVRCDFMIKLPAETNQAKISNWEFFLYPQVYNSQEDGRRRMPVRMETRRLMERISPVFLVDAWQPQELSGTKLSFVFVDEQLFDAFYDATFYAKLNNEMSIILVDPDAHTVVKEVLIVGNYYPMSVEGVFVEQPGMLSSYNDIDDEEVDDNVVFYNNDDDEW